MKDKILHIIRTKPIFLFLLPPFFVLHGFRENYDFIPVKDALSLTAVYICVSLLLSFLFWFLYRNFTKANLAAFVIMAFNLFFGSAHDLIKNTFPGSFITKYVFILPTAAILFIVLLIILKKKKSPLFKLSYYLNLLFIVLLLTDSILLAGKIINQKKTSTAIPEGFVNCNNCTKPDIYFILADEYAGNKELKDQFQFDDSVFINQLSGLNFHTIPESSSNYNYTPFSLASMLNMNYLDLKGKDRINADLIYCYEAIRDNKLLKFLRGIGYDLYNYSVFDFEGQPAQTRETFLPVKTRLITAQTFLHRFDKEIRFNFVYRFKSKKNLKILTYYNKINNENIYKLTLDLASKKTTRPKFIYTHLMMPHYPYYFDRNGIEQPFDKLLEGNQSNKAAYIEYLQYCNKKLIELVEHILQSSSSPPIIVIAGDHGFRHFNEPVESKYYFLNLVSVHLPSKNYTGFSDSLTGVNLFREILNTEYGQRLPFLKDSTSYLKD